MHQFRLQFYVRLYRSCYFVILLTATIMQQNKMSIRVVPQHCENCLWAKNLPFGKSMMEKLYTLQHATGSHASQKRCTWLQSVSTISGRTGQWLSVWETGSSQPKTILDVGIRHHFVLHFVDWLSEKQQTTKIYCAKCDTERTKQTKNIDVINLQFKQKMVGQSFFFPQSKEAKKRAHDAIYLDGQLCIELKREMPSKSWLRGICSSFFGSARQDTLFWG